MAVTNDKLLIHVIYVFIGILLWLGAIICAGPPGTYTEDDPMFFDVVVYSSTNWYHMLLYLETQIDGYLVILQTGMGIILCRLRRRIWR
jgi:hypothetical protein